MGKKRSEKIRIAGVNRMSLVNGDGARIVVFVQGCQHYCYQCQNPDTWDMNGGEEVAIDGLADEIRDLLRRHPLDGITLSGGDPYYQEKACIELIRKIKSVHPKCNVCVYTGYKFREVEHRELTKMIDILVDGPYIEYLPPAEYVGSCNQRIIYLQPEGVKE